MGKTTLMTLRMKSRAVAVAALMLVFPLHSGAAGLGKITVLSALGQALRAEVDITASREELSSLAARVASVDAFKQAGIEYSPALSSIRLTIEKRSDGRPFVSMASDRPFNEPFLDLLVELNWNSGRLVREYTFLLDPPEALQKPMSPVVAPVIAPVAAPVAVPVAPPEPRREVAASQSETKNVPAPVDLSPPQRPETKVAPVTEAAPRASKAEVATVRAEKENAQRLVKRGDTLGLIANETKPDGVNLDQMLVALYRGNQEAFEGNVNRLKAGKILAIPDRATVASVDTEDARKTIKAHSDDFISYSKKLASSVSSATAQKDEAPKRVTAGKIAPKVEEKLPPAAAGKDKLEVSKSEATAGKAGAGRLAAIEETLIAREKALKDANGRILELEKNLNDLKKLIELKNQSMAELQKQAQTAKPPTPAKTPPAAETKKPEKPADKPVEKLAEKPAEVAKPASPPKPASPVESKPASPTPSGAPAQPVSTSFMDESPEIVYGGGGIFGLLLFYFAYRWQQQRKVRKIGGAGATEPTDSVAGSGASSGGDDLLAPNDFGNLTGVVGGDGEPGVDPVAEADVYLAYGRDVQAEEILLDALKTDPTRHAIHGKLLEIYASRKSLTQFESIATELHNQTAGSGPDWAKAAELGQQIDPSNPLYGGRQESPKGFDPDATLVIPPEEQEMDFGNLETQANMADELLAPAEEAPAAPQEELPASLDFELDLAEPPSSAPAELGTLEGAVEEASPKLDIDLGLDVEVAKPTDIALGDVAAEPSQEPSTQADADFELDLDLGAAGIAAEPVTPSLPDVAPAADAGSGLDFNFDLDAGESAAAPTPTPSAESATDGNSIDFDLELPAPEAPQPKASSVDLASINLDLDAPLEPVKAPQPQELPEAEDSTNQDVETKLELALAYEEMGDKEGARELLQEVLNEGNATQKEAARSKLERLD